MTDIPAFHHRAALLWPPFEREAMGGWLLGADPSTTQRANSAIVAGPPGRPLNEALAAAADWLRARGKRPRLQLPLGVFPDLESTLPAEGWILAGHTDVMIAPARALPLPAGLAAESAETPPPVWREIESHGAADFDARLAVMTRGTAPRRFVTLSGPMGAEAVAYVAALEGWALIAAVSVRPESRGKGLGAAVMEAAMAAGQALGAAQAFVQVERANPSARRLYERLGFVRAYSYAYAAPGA